MTLRFVSYGGGVQSTALLVLAAQERIDFKTFVMANVGDDSENPTTLRYVREVAAPFAEAHGVDLHLVDRVKRDGTTETLWEQLHRPSRTINIPVRMSNGAPGNRNCTSTFKMGVTSKWAKRHGATAADPAVIGIGISFDEISRANNRKTKPHERVVYPLISVGEDTGLRLNRADCARLITDAGLPLPPKSSCFFCPFHRPSEWDEMARTQPEQFDLACGLEDTLNARREELGKDHVYLTRFAVPLRLVVNREQLPLFEDEDVGCDSGWCMT